jgi:ribosomal protein S18 acetylase RimI-like enzyme
MMTYAHASPPVAPPPNQKMRPVNLRTDLAQLADLIELVFADSMDAGGRAAIREMRAMSRLGAGLGVLGRVNELTLGVNLGYVWVDRTRVVGNVSIYPANWHQDLGVAWIIANVGVHPDYRRQGIARRLMEASLDLVRQRKGNHAILQVNYDNDNAIQLYEDLGFVRERAFSVWTRSSMAPPPRQSVHESVFITRPRNAEWRAEYEFIKTLRPAEKGGVGWLKPLHESLLHRPWWKRLSEWFSLSGTERLVVRNTNTIVASLWVENPFGSLRTHVNLFAQPEHVNVELSALLHNTLRRFRTSNITIEHPADDETTNALLKRLGFRIHRTVWHMRLDM